MSQSTILWFRQDLRLDDNPALNWAIARGNPVLPVYIWAPEEEGRWRPGAASCLWLSQSLAALEDSISKLGTKLVLRRGPSARTLMDLASETGADAICWNRRFEPQIQKRDDQLAQALQKKGLEVRTFNGSLLFDPERAMTKGDKPYQVFTSFWNNCLSEQSVRLPYDPPDKLRGPAKPVSSLSVEELILEPVREWSTSMKSVWSVGERGAVESLDRFIESILAQYITGRDYPDQQRVSRMSPHLHFGEISPHRIWWRVKDMVADKGNRKLVDSAKCYLRELGWREFSYYILFHFPETAEKPLQLKFNLFRWLEDDKNLKAWQEGRTGYPIVDAGMRELEATGWMHNRVRMIVASFLCKDLLVSWRSGSDWFWDTLVDADLASNTLGWQWAAGCGADAAPFFRIFNPVLQGQKFDPDGDYVRRWVPELANLPAPWIHQPFLAKAGVLSQAGVELGKTYALPIVDHAMARQRALDVLKSTK